ncbi:hypothetical protein M438DRAFT_350340 [Aureobasidium pullulans EXF-150]|uniref:KRAB-related domain-containing protein n=1 Tax=Aureobasidium pullulans EXF-150 TaxID=1043002 RepID=A0A074WZK7_AURPU|nr:uncharacterized protein M438DRAFT_350340 [Aureobasidium pullulans EXF-150]KEQ78593.1 hypothetical protein M438DRAFT_350340 [Aureobasidium pullulans EXF-150]
MPSKSVATKPPASGSEDEIGASDLENSRPAPPKINRTVVKKPVKKAATATKKTTAKPKLAKEPVDPPEASDADEPEPAAMEPAPKPKQRKRVLKKDLVAKHVAPAPEPDPVPEQEAAPAPTTAPVKKATKSTKAKSAEAQPEKEKPVAKSKPKTKRAPSPEPAPVIPETQPEPEEIEQSIVEEEEPPADLMDIDREPSSPPPPPKSHSRQPSASIQRQAAPGAAYSRARSTSRQPGTYSRGRSASDTERRMAESEASRRLADMTKKYEEMRMKYDSLTELGPKAAEANFERLKKATDQKAKDANDLIASLKKELADLRKTSSSTTAESAKLQSQVASLTSENEKLKGDQKTTHQSLTESQNEAKALTAKLEAARKTNAEKVPGSAVKRIDHGKMGGASAEAVKENALKEELYRDLTGLIITSVKRKDGEDEYSCIQTGRNGTLHFHLTVATDSAVTNPKTPSGLSYEDTEFAYEPLLDTNRDADLMDILPDYLTEEICFPRNHAVKFYTKVVESMTKRVVVDED